MKGKQDCSFSRRFELFVKCVEASGGRYQEELCCEICFGCSLAALAWRGKTVENNDQKSQPTQPVMPVYGIPFDPGIFHHFVNYVRCKR